jgi:hypothetical protein
VAVQLAMSGRWALARRIPLTLGTQLRLDGGGIALRALGLLAAAAPAQPVELELLMDQLQEEQELHTKAKAETKSTLEKGTTADSGINDHLNTATIEISQRGWNDAIIDILRRKQHSAPSGGLPRGEAEALVARIWPPDPLDESADPSTTSESKSASDVADADGFVSRCEAWLLCRELGRAYSEAAKVASMALSASSSRSYKMHLLEPMRSVLAVARNLKDERMMDLAEQFLLQATS